MSSPLSLRPDTNKWLVLVIVCLAQFMVVLDATVVNVALPSIQRGLDFSPGDLQWVINAYTLLFGGFLLLGGRAADLVGRKRLFVIGVAVFSIASLINGLAQSSGMLIAGRALQGLGGALVSPAALSIITTTFTDNTERTRALWMACPMRADAERNRRRLLDAAAAFAEHGLDVSVSEIARRAEVGKGTLFRRFPTKDHLIAAIVIDRFEAHVATGRGLREHDDPGEAMADWIRAGARLMAEDRGLFEAVAAPILDDAGVRSLYDEYLDITAALLARAQERGAVRADVTAEDVALLTGAICQASAPLLDLVPDLWRRYADLILDGLRPEAARPSSQPSPTRAQLNQAHAAKMRSARGA